MKLQVSKDTRCDPRGAGMLYDERRSFSVYVDASLHNFDLAKRLILERGVTKALGSKAYFSASREGAHVRVYLDKTLPALTW